MNNLKRIFFSLAALLFIFLLVALVAVEIVPLYIWFVFTGKAQGLSERLAAKIFAYMDNRFESIGKHIS